MASPPGAEVRGAGRVAFAFVGAAAVSWLRAALAGTLRVDESGLGWPARIALGLAFGFFVVLAGVHYLRAVRDSAEQPLSPRLLPATFFIHLCAATALPLTSNDLFSNLAYGRLAQLGLNPYLSGPRALGAGDTFASLVGARWMDAPTVYGPILTGLTSLIGRVDSVLGALLLFKLALLGCSILAIGLAFFIGRRLPPARATSAFILVAWNPVLLWELTAQAHNDGVMVVALLVFVAAALRGRDWLATLGLAAALWAKFAAAPLAVLWLGLILRRSPGRAIAMAVALALGGVALAAPYWAGQATLAGPLLAAGGDATRTTSSLASLLCKLATPLGPAAVHGVYAFCRAAGLALLAFLGLRALLRGRTLEQLLHDGLLIFLAYCLLAAPWFQPWYVSWLLPLALVEKDAELRRTVAIYSLLIVAQYALPADPLSVVAVNLWTLHRLLRRPFSPFGPFRKAHS